VTDKGLLSDGTATPREAVVISSPRGALSRSPCEGEKPVSVEPLGADHVFADDLGGIILGHQPPAAQLLINRMTAPDASTFPYA
jgi:hypothetical protein